MGKHSGWQGIVSFNTGGAMTTLAMRAASISVLSLLLAGCQAPLSEAPLAVEGFQACEAKLPACITWAEQRDLRKIRGSQIDEEN